MRLYSRNYLDGLTPDEEAVYQDVLRKEKEGHIGNIRTNLYHQYPLAARNYLSLFPNHHLDIIDLKANTATATLNSDFLQLLLSETTHEQTILHYINRTPAFHIVGAILRGGQFRFGHHSAYLFPEFKLGTSYEVDYLLIGKNSGGHEFVFIEFESPKCKGNKKVTLEDGELGNIFLSGIKQVKNWRRWLKDNYTSLSEYYEKETKRGTSLPKEFLKFDDTRIHYVVVAGMRNDFTDKTYYVSRESMINERIQLLHYENLYDFACQILNEPTY